MKKALGVDTVAPFTGAWIEIRQEISMASSNTNVAPFTGAWIEIEKDDSVIRCVKVAPFTGAWIEIGEV